MVNTLIHTVYVPDTHVQSPFPAFAARLKAFFCSRLAHRRDPPPLATVIDAKSASSSTSTASVFILLETTVMILVFVLVDVNSVF